MTRPPALEYSWATRPGIRTEETTRRGTLPPGDYTATNRGRSIAVSGHGSIASSFIRAVAIDRGRQDIAARIDDIESRYCRYSGEDGDVLGSAWSSLGWPVPVLPVDPTQYDADGFKVHTHNFDSDRY